MKFRKDINGLRAIAVIAVVLFHFNPTWMPGGFAGVDVFFVISGFLMTGIIFRGIEQQSFSISKFYVARASRIIPALAALCSVLLVFGWFYLISIDYAILGKHAASSIAFFSNYTYLNEAGYFDSASHQKWLLHTWSLSVEWQFYLLYPLALVLASKFFNIEAMKRLLLAATVIGFAYCIYASEQTPDAAYYLLPSRAWEMLMGGVAYLYPLSISQKHKKYSEWLGLIFIIGAYVFISAEVAWPGHLALFPVLGVFLIIQAQRENSIFTSSWIAQKLGAWSYSIYLWHWPIVVAIYYFDLNNYFVYSGMLLSILLGYLSYRFIEKRSFKSNLRGFKRVLTYKPLYMVIIVALVGRVTYKTQGFIWHYPDDVIVATNEAENKNPYNCMTDEIFPCHIGNKNNIKAIIVGDSHADALTTSLTSAFDLKTQGVIALTKASCPLVLNLKPIDDTDKCAEANLERVSFLSENHLNVPVFWVARTSAYLYGQTDPDRISSPKDTKPSIYFTKRYDYAEDELLNELQNNLDNTIKKIANNRSVFLVLPIPEIRKNVPKVISKALFINNKKVSLSVDYDLYYERNKPVITVTEQVAVSSIAGNNQVEVLNPALYLCEAGRCMAQYKNRPIYYDGDHMSEYGNKLLTPMFKKALAID